MAGLVKKTKIAWKKYQQFHVFGALSEFERNLIKERTIAARARGRQGGRPEKLSDEQNWPFGKPA